jgi:hypothetical protein
MLQNFLSGGDNSWAKNVCGLDSAYGRDTFLIDGYKHFHAKNENRR